MNFLYSTYFAFPNFAFLGLPGKVINRLMSKFIKIIFDLTLPFYFKRTADKVGKGLNSDKRKEIYIVSLTSFPARINEIWITIETILRQSFKPDKIILWLAKEQFPDGKIPENLINLKKRGLSIEFCDDNLKSHKKYFYAMKHFPNANLITLDDDLYYDKYTLSNLAELHNKYPEMIVTNRAHKFTFHKNGNLKKYRLWKHNVTDTIPSLSLVPTGGAGTLYPPGVISQDVFNIELIKDLCINADDLWLKMMSLRNNKLVVTNKKYNKDFITVFSTQKVKLVSGNVLNEENDKQLENLIGHFGIDLSVLCYENQREN